jgi:two-component system, chemotaxis family, sensor kinase Cph1
MEQVDVGALAREAFEDLRAATPERDIRLRVGDLPPVLCDRDMIRQALAKLLDNAIKFTSQRAEASIEIGSAVTDEEHIYFVRDNGVGFDM